MITFRDTHLAIRLCSVVAGTKQEVHACKWLADKSRVGSLTAVKLDAVYLGEAHAKGAKRSSVCVPCIRVHLALQYMAYKLAMKGCPIPVHLHVEGEGLSATGFAACLLICFTIQYGMCW